MEKDVKLWKWNFKKKIYLYFGNVFEFIYIWSIVYYIYKWVFCDKNDINFILKNMCWMKGKKVFC